ncbi:hypothetical protein HSR121_0411 [Halapricum desulfuricans]|uniref:Uncharacterized protein n=1 Tax=Halapricum desulfuricans TaxID=2841257 RepID=A0A897MWB9_9EURY|nr:hypothetical protein HSR121_0411 [Halapricum desulfuricans]
MSVAPLVCHCMMSVLRDEIREDARNTNRTTDGGNVAYAGERLV